MSAAQEKDSKLNKTTVMQPPPGIAPPLSPGPAQYSHPDLVGNNTANMRKAPHITMGAKLKELKATDIPGPGAYEPKTVLGEGVPKFSMGARTVAPKAEYLVGGTKHGVISPGPGAYNAPEPQPKKITMFPKARDPAPPNYPGPQYDIPEKKEPGFKIGKEVRGSLVPGVKSQKRPDPTTYNLPGLIGVDARKPNLKGGRDNPKYFLTPGPGAYTPVLPEKKGWSMGARHKQSFTTYVSSTNPLGVVETVIFDEEAQ